MDNKNKKQKQFADSKGAIDIKVASLLGVMVWGAVFIFTISLYQPVEKELTSLSQLQESSVERVSSKENPYKHFPPETVAVDVKESVVSDASDKESGGLISKVLGVKDGLTTEKVQAIVEDTLYVFLQQDFFRGESGPAGPPGPQGPEGVRSVQIIAPAAKEGGIVGSFKYLAGSSITGETLELTGSLTQTGGTASLLDTTVTGELSVSGATSLSSINFSSATSTASLHAAEVCIALECRISWPSSSSPWNTYANGDLLAPTNTVASLVFGATATTSSAKLSVYTLTADQSGVVIKATTGHSANLLELQNSSAAFLSGFTAAGGLLINISSTTAVNIQDGSGTTIFSIDTSSLTATTTLNNGLVIDSTTLVVNAKENRVGIGLANPSVELEVMGTASTSVLYVGGVGEGATTTTLYGGVLIDSTTLVVNAKENRVGIGTATPNNTIQVAGLINFDDPKDSTFLGVNAGSDTMTGQDNVFIGESSGDLISSGLRNVFVGYQSGRVHTGGGDNVYIGNGSGYSSTLANYNVSIGATAARNTTFGSRNVSIGVSSGYNVSTGNYNTFLGSYAGYNVYNNLAGNVIIGDSAGYNAQGDNNVYIGKEVGYNGIGDNTLMIDNSSTPAPLLLGNFELDYLNINGKLAVTYASTTPTAKFSVLPEAGGYTGTDMLVQVATTTLDSSTTTIFSITADGNVGIATTTPRQNLVVVGNVCVDDTAGVDCGSRTISNGAIEAEGTITSNAFDVAEVYGSDGTLEPGDMVTMKPLLSSTYSGDPSTVPEVEKMTSSHKRQILGVVSTKPAFILGWNRDDNDVNIAIGGRVPVKIDGQPVVTGDALTISSEAGVATKATTSSYIIGYALEDYNSANSTSTDPKILVFINPGWYEAPAQEDSGSVFLEKVAATLDEFGIIIQQGWIQTKTIVADVLHVKRLELGTPDEPGGITLYDTVTREPYCVTMTGGVLQNKPGKCNE